MRSFTFECGRLLCGKVRNFLEQAKFEGLDIEFYESSGFISRTFAVKGSPEHVKLIYSQLRAALGYKG